MKDDVLPFGGVARGALMEPPRPKLKDIFSRVHDLHDANSIVTLQRENYLTGSARYEVCRAGATGNWEFLHLRPGFYMILANTIYKDDIQGVIPGEGLLEFHFKLSGRLVLSSEGENLADITGPGLLIWRQLEKISVDELIYGGRREASATIYCDPEFCSEVFGPVAGSLSAEAKDVLFNNADPIITRQLPLPPALALRVDSLINDYDRNPLRLLKADADGLSLICLALSALRPDHAKTSEAPGLKKLEAIRLHEAFDILNEEFASPPSISVLARRVGLNETKLKSGFNSLFGHTISEFIRKRRMETACQMMREKSMPISLVSRAVGYEHPNSFTVAFKAWFGVLPKDFRKMPTE